MQTHIFKHVVGCGIRADVYPAAGGGGPAPALVMLHGGALIWGSCSYMTRPEQVELFTRAGYTYIAMDYRLAPESPIPQILEDVRDGLRWVREVGAATLGIDPARIGLLGHSAGGYLALLAGVHADPPPACVVSLYGYGDLAAPCYTEPSTFHRQRPLIPEAEARAAVGTQPLTVGDRARSLFYGYCRQQGLWSRAAAGLEASAPPEALHRWSPERTLGPGYPPTLLLHGDLDSDVPLALSESMAAALTAAGVENRLIRMTGFGHVFDDQFTHPDVVHAFQAILDFLDTHLR